MVKPENICVLNWRLSYHQKTYGNFSFFTRGNCSQLLKGVGTNPLSNSSSWAPTPCSWDSHHQYSDHYGHDQIYQYILWSMFETDSYDEIYQYLPHSKDHNHADHEEGEKREKGAQREDEGLRKYWILGQSRTTQVGWRNSPPKLPNQSFLCSSYFMCCWIIFVHDDFVDFSKARAIFY